MTTQPVNTPEPRGVPTRKHLVSRRREVGGPGTWNMNLVAAGTGVPARQVAESPALMLAAVEDLCWRLAFVEQRKQRPRWWRRRERAAWREECALLEAKRARIAEMTAEAVREL